MTNICGHDREALRYWLANESDHVDISDSCDVCPGCRAIDAIHDPAKLAAIIAELLRDRGVRASIEMDRPDNRLDIWVNHFPNDSHPNETPGIGIRSCRRGRFGERIVEDLNMPQARAFALALLAASFDDPAMPVDVCSACMGQGSHVQSGIACPHCKGSGNGS